MISKRPTYLFWHHVAENVGGVNQNSNKRSRQKRSKIRLMRNDTYGIMLMGLWTFHYREV